MLTEQNIQERASKKHTSNVDYLIIDLSHSHGDKTDTAQWLTQCVRVSSTVTVELTCTCYFFLPLNPAPALNLK